jgi:PPK2 family polyphosphate:nucleotide phosphotransferase
MKKPADIEKLFRCNGKKKVRLAKIDPGQKTGFEDRAKAERRTDEDIGAIDALQDRLYAEGRQALLVVLQAMDAGGKDGTLRRIFGPVDPLGMRAVAFKAPTPDEIAHDFLWRIHKQTPAKGEICVFNRSHYEDVLVVRVRNLAPRHVIEKRYEQINAFERQLADDGVTIVKLFLHISKDEQRERLQERIDLPEKRWKFNPGDLEDRKFWDDYMEAYEIALNRCSTPWAPWYVVPANRNWYRNAVVAAIIRARLQAMDPQYPVKDVDPSIRVV